MSSAGNDARLYFRLPAELKEIIEQAAAHTGQTVSDFAVSMLVDSARKVIEEHDRSRFDCGSTQLNDWLRKQVSQYQKRDLSRTYVAVPYGASLGRGYYALYMKYGFASLRNDPRHLFLPLHVIRKLNLPAPDMD